LFLIKVWRKSATVLHSKKFQQEGGQLACHNITKRVLYRPERFILVFKGSGALFLVK
jgi:hypothetical protein